MASLTPPTPVMAGNPGLLNCVISQGELFHMRAILEGARIALQQIAGIREARSIEVTTLDGRTINMPVHCIAAHAALRDLFGVTMPIPMDPDEPDFSDGDDDEVDLSIEEINDINSIIEPSKPVPPTSGQPRWKPTIVK